MDVVVGGDRKSRIGGPNVGVSRGGGGVQMLIDDTGNSLEDAEIEMVEEDTVGQIIQGEDGEFYVVVEDGAPDVELDRLNNIQVLVNDDGSETLVLENEQHNVSLGGRPMERRHAIDYDIRANPVDGGVRRGGPRTVFAETEDGGYEMVQLLDEEDGPNGADMDGPPDQMGLGAMATAETSDVLGLDLFEPIPQGMKMRRNRVYGTCRCPECGQSFVNTARLERHLAVHQVFGSFLCPLCGKTYKYEYNLFYHWRRTCRDLNELMPIDERKSMDVNALRQLVDEVAQKKAEIGPIEIGINRNMLYAGSPLARLEMPSNSLGRRGTTCRACGVVVLAAHMPRHLAIHKGEANVDERGVCGGFYCDLCGLMFRQHFNLIKHWRTGCPEIQANLPEEELTMDDDGLRRMVMKLMKRSVTQELLDESIEQADSAQRMGRSIHKVNLEDDSDVRFDEIRDKGNDVLGDEVVDVTHSGGRGDLLGREESGNRLLDDGSNVESVDHDFVNRADIGKSALDPDDDSYMYDERWAEEQGIVFADDFMDDDDALVIGEDGTLGPLGMNTQNRAKWSMSGGPVQCPECFRSFANSGRLERHLAGFHASFGSHHCMLCGNRFKYDYNLLYHYRRSCPYTKAFIDRDVREQLDAMSLRKLVRTLSQKEVRLNPQTMPPSRLFRRDPIDLIGSRRQMLRYPTPVNQPPPHLLVPRPGLHDGKSCPVCMVIFYGAGAVDRHMKAAHPLEWDEFNAHGLSDDVLDDRDGLDQFEPEEEVEPPPTLTAEAPGEQPVVRPLQPTIRRAHHIEEDEDGNQRLVDENGLVIEAAEGEEVHVQMDDLGDVQRLIESGELQVRHGDQIILVQDEDEYGAEMTEGQLQEVQADGYRSAYVEQVSAAEPQRPYEGTVDSDAPTVKKRARFAKEIVKGPDEGLEVAAILTEMKQNEPPDSIASSSAAEVDDELQEQSTSTASPQRHTVSVEGTSNNQKVNDEQLQVEGEAVDDTELLQSNNETIPNTPVKSDASNYDESSPSVVGAETAVRPDVDSSEASGEGFSRNDRAVSARKRRSVLSESAESFLTSPSRQSPRAVSMQGDSSSWKTRRVIGL